MIVIHGVAADSCDVLPQPRNDGTRSRSGCGVTGDPREAPRRRIVPEVLDARIVVEGYAVNEFFAADIPFIRVADIGVIDAEMVILGIVSYLSKTADVCCPSPGNKERHILRKFKIAVLGSRLG